MGHTHTHSVLMAIFPGEPGLAGCPLNSPSPFNPGYYSKWHNMSIIYYKQFQFSMVSEVLMSKTVYYQIFSTQKSNTNWCTPSFKVL